jgi:WD40 repeat protein
LVSTEGIYLAIKKEKLDSTSQATIENKWSYHFNLLEVESFPKNHHINQEKNIVAYSPNYSSDLLIWNIDKKIVDTISIHKSWIESLSLIKYNNTTHLVSGDLKGNLFIIDLSNNQLIDSIKIDLQKWNIKESYPTKIQYIPETKILIVGLNNGVLLRVNLNRSEYADDYDIIGTASEPLQGMILNNNNNELITANQNKLKYWDLYYYFEDYLQSLQLLIDKKAHDFRINNICNHPSLDLVVTSGKDRLIKFWNTKNGRLITQLYLLQGYRKYKYSYDYSQDYFFLHYDGTFSGNEMGLKSLNLLKRKKVVPVKSSNKNYRDKFSILDLR